MEKIIFNTDSLIMGGAEKIAVDYANLLVQDYEILFLINEDNGDKGNILLPMLDSRVEYRFVVEKEIMEKLNKYRELKKKNIFYKILYSYYLRKRRNSYRKNIVEILKKEQYKHLIDFYCKIPKEVIDNRTISWLHMTLGDMKEKVKKEYKEKFEKCGSIIVLNEDMREQVEKAFPGTKKKIKKIYNFFNIEEIEKKSMDRNNLSQKEKELLKDEYIVSCCRLDRQKDMDTLIKAFNLLKTERKITEKLYVIGDGSERERLEKMVESFKLQKEVVFLGTQINPHIWMKNAKLFVHSSHKEGFGMVLVEGLINNGVVISTDCPVGPREILENGKSGLLVKHENIKDMTVALEKCLKDTRFREELKRGAERRKMDFSTEKIRGQLKEIL